MNNPNTPNIGDVRAQIDAIDTQLAALIAARCQLSASVSAAKRANGDHAFGWRPAREVEILRQALKNEASLDPKLAFCVWRALISTNLSAQGDLHILAVPETQLAAAAAFSASAPAFLAHDASDLLHKIAGHDHAIGLLPWPSSGATWWVTMMDSAFDGLHVCAATPLYTHGNTPDAVLIAARMPEAAGGDVSLIAAPVGSIEGEVLSVHGGKALVAVAGFVTDLPARCRLIGTYALA